MPSTPVVSGRDAPQPMLYCACVLLQGAACCCSQVCLLVQILWTYILSQAAAAAVVTVQQPAAAVVKGEPEPEQHLSIPQQVAVFLTEEEQIAAMQLVVEELASNPPLETENPQTPATA